MNAADDAYESNRKILCQPIYEPVGKLKKIGRYEKSLFQNVTFSYGLALEKSLNMSKLTY